MKTQETSPLAAASVGEMKDVMALLVQSVPNLTSAGAQNVIGSKQKFITDIRAVFSKYAAVQAIDLLLIEWQNFYRDLFRLELAFDDIAVPEHQHGVDRLLVIAQGLTLEEVFRKCSELFACEKFAKNLDRSISVNERSPKNRPYAIWVRDRVEADEEFRNMSAMDLKAAYIPAITLLERLIFELRYWGETHTHLDILDTTLCAGSRDLAGRVPTVRWDDDRFVVALSQVDASDSELRAREAIG
jgi:hypothetical protein